MGGQTATVLDRAWTDRDLVHYRCHFDGPVPEACQDVTARLEAADRLQAHGLPDDARNLRHQASDVRQRHWEADQLRRQEGL